MSLNPKQQGVILVGVVALFLNFFFVPYEYVRSGLHLSRPQEEGSQTRGAGYHSVIDPPRPVEGTPWQEVRVNADLWVAQFIFLLLTFGLATLYYRNEEKGEYGRVGGKGWVAVRSEELRELRYYYRHPEKLIKHTEQARNTRLFAPADEAGKDKDDKEEGGISPEDKEHESPFDRLRREESD